MKRELGTGSRSLAPISHLFVAVDGAAVVMAREITEVGEEVEVDGKPHQRSASADRGPRRKAIRRH